MLESDFNEYNFLCLMSDKSFNQSVMLDLESFFIKYKNLEDKNKRTNSNPRIGGL